MADGKELEAWLCLGPASGLGGRGSAALAGGLWVAQAVLDAGPGAWREVGGAEAAKALAQPSDLAQQMLNQGMQWQANTADAQVIALGEAAYPAALLQTADPPFLLFCRGNLGLLQQPSLAIVGSRHATAQGVENAKAFAKHLSDAGLCIVSGLAAGIDGGCSRGGVSADAAAPSPSWEQGRSSFTPRRHQKLGERIALEGLLLTEFCPGTPPLPINSRSATASLRVCHWAPWWWKLRFKAAL